MGNKSSLHGNQKEQDGKGIDYMLKYSPLKRVRTSTSSSRSSALSKFSSPIETNHSSASYINKPNDFTFDGLETWGTDDLESKSLESVSISLPKDESKKALEMIEKGVNAKLLIDLIKSDKAIAGKLIRNGRKGYRVKEWIKDIRSKNKGNISILGECSSVDGIAKDNKIADVVIICSYDQLLCDFVACLEEILSSHLRSARRSDDLFIWFSPLMFSLRQIDSEPSERMNCIKSVVQSVKNTVFVYPTKGFKYFDCNSIDYWGLIYSASVKDARLRVIFPQAQQRFYCEAVKDDPYAAMNMFNDLKYQHQCKNNSRGINSISPTPSPIATSQLDQALQRINSLIADWKIIKMIDFVTSIEEAVGCSKPLDLSILYDNVSLILSSERQYLLQETYLLKSLDIKLCNYGELHSEIAKCLNRIGTCYFNQNLFDKAQAKFQKAMNIWIATLGPTHSFVAIGAHNLAYVLYIKQQEDKASEVIANCQAINHFNDNRNIKSALSSFRRSFNKKDECDMMIQNDMIILS